MPFFFGALWRESWLLLLLLGLLTGPSWEPVEFLRSLMSSWLTVCSAPLCSLSKRRGLGEDGGRFHILSSSCRLVPLLWKLATES